MIDLSTVLSEEIEKIDKWIKQAATERDESATPTESTHDQTRQVANQLFNSLLEEKAKLQRLTNIVKKYHTIYEIQSENNIRIKVMLVPSGLGGKKYEDVLLVAENSPLGEKLSNLTSGDTYQMNDKGFKVITVTDF